MKSKNNISEPWLYVKLALQNLEREKISLHVSHIYICKASGKWFFAISYPKLRPYWQNCQSWVGKPLAWQQPWAWETQTTKKCMNLYVCLTTFWQIYLSIKISFSRFKLMVCIPCIVLINWYEWYQLLLNPFYQDHFVVFAWFYKTTQIIKKQIL